MNNNFKHIKLTNQHHIRIFDNLFNEHQKEHIFNFISNSNFKFDGNYTDNRFKIKSNGKQYIQSIFSGSDLAQLKLLEFVINSVHGKVIRSLLQDCLPIRSYVFCSDHTSQHGYHLDPSNYTMLYYPNLEWDPSYGGETMFADPNLSEILYTSMYVPGRLIIFNSDIYHKMSAPSSSCPFHRFSFIVNWSKNETRNGNNQQVNTN